MSEDVKKSDKKKKQEQAVDALFPVAAESEMPALPVATPEVISTGAEPVAEVPTSTPEIGEASGAPEVVEDPKSGSGDPAPTAEAPLEDATVPSECLTPIDDVDGIDPGTDECNPGMLEILPRVAEEIMKRSEKANLRAADGLANVNLHGTRLMNRARGLRNEILSFVDFLKKEKIDG